MSEFRIWPKRTWLMRSRNTSWLSRPSAGGCPWLSITRAACWDSCRAVYARSDLWQAISSASGCGASRLTGAACRMGRHIAVVSDVMFQTRVRAGSLMTGLQSTIETVRLHSSPQARVVVAQSQAHRLQPRDGRRQQQVLPEAWRSQHAAFAVRCTRQAHRITSRRFASSEAL